MDNAAKDNKNAIMFAYLSALVELNWFKAIYVHFLPPGHTHSNLDQKYSVISQRLKNKDIFTLPQLQQELAPLFQHEGPYTGQYDVGAIGDYAEYFNKKTNKLHGHGTCTIRGANRRIHAFKVTKDGTGRAGVFFKEHDDFVPWRGQWDDNDLPIYVLKQDWSSGTDVLKAAPRLKLKELDAIQEHWKRIVAVINHGNEHDVENAPTLPEEDPLLDDSDHGCDIDQPAIPVGQDFKRKWEEGITWWDSFFQEEKSFWSAKPGCVR